MHTVVAEDWKSAGLAKLSTTTLYNDIRRLVDRCCAVFDCSDTGYDLDGIVLDYVIYRYCRAHFTVAGTCGAFVVSDVASESMTWS